MKANATGIFIKDMWHGCLHAFRVSPGVGLMILAGAVLMLGSGCEKSITADPAPTPEAAVKIPQVQVMELDVRPYSWPLQLEGICVTPQETTLSAKVQGEIQDILVEEGDRVGESQPLARIDPLEWRALRNQAEANRRALEAQLNKLRAGLLKEEVRQAAASLDSAKANYQRLFQDVERQERLHRSGMLRQSDYDDYQTRLQVAQADLDRASAAYRLSMKGFRSEEISQVEAQVDGAAAALELAEIKLGYTQIASPFAGVIARRHVARGNYVIPGSPLFTLESLSPIRVETYIPSSDIAKVRKGLRAEVQVLSYPDVVFSGTAEILGAGLDQSTRTLPVKITLPNDDGRLKPGMSAHLTLYPDPVPSIVIPGHTVFTEGDREFVSLVKNNTIQRVTIRTGERHEQWVHAVDGLQAGDLLVLTDVGGLSDGTTVQPNRTTPAAVLESKVQ